jgi:hypothetical protein
MRIIFTQGNYRIVEHVDTDTTASEIQGEFLGAQHQRDFYAMVEEKGVYGYELDRWNPAVGKGWEHVDSCWGFVGQFCETEEMFNHYIVDEMKRAIKDKNEERGE